MRFFLCPVADDYPTDFTFQCWLINLRIPTFSPLLLLVCFFFFWVLCVEICPLKVHGETSLKCHYKDGWAHSSFQNVSSDRENTCRVALPSRIRAAVSTRLILSAVTFSGTTKRTWERPLLDPGRWTQRLGMMTHAFNLSSQVAEAGGSQYTENKINKSIFLILKALFTKHSYIYVEKKKG